MNDKHLPIEIQPPKWYLRRDNIQEEAIMSTGSALQARMNIEGKALLGLAFCLGVGSHLVGSSRLSILSLKLMGEAIYQPRGPKVSPLCQSILNHFAEFESVYEERYEKQYGFLRDAVLKMVYSYHFSCTQEARERFKVL